MVVWPMVVDGPMEEVVWPGSVVGDKVVDIGLVDERELVETGP